MSITYRLDGLIRYTVDGLGDLVDLVSLGVVDKAVARELETSADILTVLKLLELGTSLSLSDLLAADLTSGDALDGLNGGLGGLSDGMGGAGDGGVQKTSIGVDGAGGLDLGGGGSLGLAEDSETGGPLDGRLATKESAKDSNLWLVELASEGAGAGEGNDEGVATVVGKALLTTVVLGLLGTLAELLERGGRDVVEELANPLGELAVVSTVGDNGEVGLGVCALGEVGDGLGVEVLGVGGLRGGGGRVAEAAVEGEAVGRVDGHVDGAAGEALVGEVDQGENLLVVDVGCACQLDT